MGMGLLKFGAVIQAVAASACGMSLSIGARSLDDPVIAAVVTSVIDGDTIKVQLSDGPALVRLANIDAPEAIQSGGGAATRALHHRILGQNVSRASSNAIATSAWLRWSSSAKKTSMPGW
jgi:endonuclease YncB( thermonuclease family)